MRGIVERKKKISILIPCFNEVNNIEAMAKVVTEQMQKMKKYDYEVVFRDNASTDGSIEVLRRIARRDKRIKVIVNSRNYGVDNTKSSYVGRISGDVIINIACDFQEPPELIPEFIHWWEEGYEVVCGQKTESKEGFLKYQCRQVYYGIINMFSTVPQYKNISGITLMSRKVQERYWASDMDIPFRNYVADAGYDVKLIPYQQQKRKSGRSSYNIWRYLSFAISSMVVTSTTPLRIATVLGMFCSMLSFLVGLIYLIQKLVWWDKFSQGTAPILIGMFFVGSIQLFFTGLIGEYIGVILKKVSISSPPLIRELINFDGEDDYMISGISEKNNSGEGQDDIVD